MCISKHENKHVSLLAPNSFDSEDSTGIVGGGKEKLPFSIENVFVSAGLIIS